MEAARLFANVANSDPLALKLCQQLLSDSDPDVRCHAALGLARTGDYRTEVIVELIHFLSSHAAVEAAVSGFFADASDDVWKVMLSLLSAEKAKVRLEAARSLAEFGRVDKQVIEILLSPEVDRPGERYESLDLLAKVGRDNEQVVQTLVTAMNERPSVRLVAIRVLLTLGRADAEMIRELLLALYEEDYEARYDIRNVLVSRGREDEQFVRTLIGLLNQGEPRERLAAAQMLIELGRAEEEAVLSLVSLLTDNAPDVQNEALQMIERLDRAGDQFVLGRYYFADRQNEDVVLSLLDNEHPGRSEVSLLVRLGLVNQASLALLAMINDKKPLITLRVAGVLVRLGNVDENVIHRIVSLLSDESSLARILAARLLVILGRVDEQVIQTLITLLDDEPQRYVAVDLLMRLNRRDERVLPRVLSSLRIVEPRKSVARAALLVAMDCKDEEIGRALKPLLASEQRENRYRAAELLARIGRTDEEIVQVLVESLQDSAYAYIGLSALIRLVRGDRQIVAQLLPWLTEVSDRPERLVQSMQTVDNEFLATLGEAVLTDNRGRWAAWTNFVSCGKVNSTEEGQSLAALVSTGPNDSTLQRFARRLLFDRLWKAHSGQALETNSTDFVEQMGLFG